MGRCRYGGCDQRACEPSGGAAGPGAVGRAQLDPRAGHLRIDLGSGEMVWFYRYLPNDQWDLDWIVGRQVMTMPVDGAEKNLITAVVTNSRPNYGLRNAGQGGVNYRWDTASLQEVVTNVMTRIS